MHPYRDSTKPAPQKMTWWDWFRCRFVRHHWVLVWLPIEEEYLRWRCSRCKKSRFKSWIDFETTVYGFENVMDALRNVMSAMKEKS